MLWYFFNLDYFKTSQILDILDMPPRRSRTNAQMKIVLMYRAYTETALQWVTSIESFQYCALSFNFTLS